jgi:hypothetical protein
MYNVGKDKILILDCESDGLYGEIFAVAAVVANLSDYEIIDKIAIANKKYFDYGDCKKPVSGWVQDNVISAIFKYPKHFIFYINYEALRDEFWGFYKIHKDTSIIIADFGAPVEAKFFHDCVCDNISTREFQGPYPLHEFGSILAMKGFDPDMDRNPYYLENQIKHNPLHDVYSTLECIKLEKLLE